MTDKRAYNLRSGGSEAVIPVQFEVSDDRFISSLLQSQQNTSKTGQVSDSDSGSESNDSMSNNDSDTERLGASESTGIDKQVPGSSSSSNTSSSAVVSQQEINLQILTQLGSITERLDMIESRKKCKKSNDVRKLKSKSKKHTVMPQPPVTLPPTQVSAPTLPNLSVLREDAYIQAQVEQRLKNLMEDSKSGTKIKSLRGGAVEVVVPHRVKWPQEYVLAGSKKERVQYDQLSMSQWVAGFCRIMRDETDAQNKDSMLDYLISLLEDAQDFSWDAARASHAVLLCRMEQGDVKNYKDVDKID